MFLSRSSGLASRVLALTLMLLVLAVIALPMAHAGTMRGSGSAVRLVPAPVFGHTDSMFVPAMATDGPSRASVETLCEVVPGPRALTVHLVSAPPVNAAPRPIQAPLRI